MSIKYSFQKYDEQKMACAIAKNLAISTKQAVEICSFLKGKTDLQAEKILSEVIELKKAIPFKRFTEGAGHKPGMASGKYPVKAASAILDLLKTTKANAENKGLSSPLKIVHISANAGPNTPRYGRQRGRSAKRTHVELILAETPDSKLESKSTKVISGKNNSKNTNNNSEKTTSKAKEVEQKKSETKEQDKETLKTEINTDKTTQKVEVLDSKNSETKKSETEKEDLSEKSEAKE